MRTEITVRFSIYGEHFYKDAKLKRIARKHPHEFGIIVKMPIYSPREVEWIEFKEYLRKEILNKFPVAIREVGKFIDFGKLSCEEIAVEIAKIVSKRYARDLAITVEELDEDCGATVSFSQKEIEKFAKEQSKHKGEYIA